MGIFGKLFGKTTPGNLSPAAEVRATSDAREFPEGMRPLDSLQAEMIAAWLDKAPSLLSRFGSSENPDELRNYDAAFKAWLSSDRSDPSRDDVISWLGAYLGNRLVTDHDMQWVMVTDQYGEELGVRHRSLQIVAFPFDTVIKRIASGECGFIAAVHKAIGDGIAQGGAAQR